MLMLVCILFFWLRWFSLLNDTLGAQDRWFCELFHYLLFCVSLQSVCMCVCMNHACKDVVYGILGGTMALILFLVLVSSLA